MLITTVVKVDTLFKAQARYMYLQMRKSVENKFNKVNVENVIFNSKNEKILVIYYIVCLKNKN
ncbi:hypothetical protein AS361_06285 [Myroides marinus]|nr:hypothetical protein AS361_06285 [Myroides marinus]